MIDLLMLAGFVGVVCVIVGALAPPAARSSRLVAIGAVLLAVFIVGVLALVLQAEGAYARALVAR